ncbi:hypothetical protein CAOG_008592 [Capsaspora owczarzaki ATCC 30864]|uniref:Leucine-rich repeat and WD repeat-containing protein 1 WD domain-containing protein n=2 Tax=Capsaspora owczarzaki (strain ATCC 30864) TaxID=595528 RepID=A0A0D2VLM4_CAPO3|nr:hypothetical protein CAOG_008592 [Capsaspora owczarzaki ATCC 30864]
MSAEGRRAAASPLVDNPNSPRKISAPSPRKSMLIPAPTDADDSLLIPHDDDKDNHNDNDNDDQNEDDGHGAEEDDGAETHGAAVSNGHSSRKKSHGATRSSGSDQTHSTESREGLQTPARRVVAAAAAATAPTNNSPKMAAANLSRSQRDLFDMDQDEAKEDMHDSESSQRLSKPSSRARRQQETTSTGSESETNEFSTISAAKSRAAIAAERNRMLKEQQAKAAAEAEQQRRARLQLLKDRRQARRLANIEAHGQRQESVGAALLATVGPSSASSKTLLETGGLRSRRPDRESDEDEEPEDEDDDDDDEDGDDQDDAQSKNDAGDHGTPVYACAFEPKVDGDGTTRVVATAGGESICLIDCEAGQVLQKYVHEDEEFFALAWTTVVLRTSDGEVATNLLAAAGASSDKKIILWDIGLPRGVKHKSMAVPLAFFYADSPVNCVSLSHSGACILASCDDGSVVYFDFPASVLLGAGYIVAKNKPLMIKTCIRFRGTSFHLQFVDCAMFIEGNLIASKGALSPRILLWDLARAIVAHKEGRYERAGTPTTSTRANTPAVAVGGDDVHVVGWLPYSRTPEYFMKFCISADAEYLIAGTETGNVTVYSLSNRTLPTVLSCPNLQFSSPVRQTAVDSGMKYIVAVSNTNLVAIWKRKTATEPSDTSTPMSM